MCHKGFNFCISRLIYEFYICLDFLRTASALGQNFFTCLPVLEKPGGLPSRRVEEDSLGVWLPAGTKGRAQGLSPGGGEGHRERHFA